MKGRACRKIRGELQKVVEEKLPPPHRPILRIHYGSRAMESAFLQNAGRGALGGQRVRSNLPSAAARDREGDESGSNLGGVASAFEARHDAIGDLHRVR